MLIGGSVLAGVDNSSGVLVNSGGIDVGGPLRSLTIKGSVMGSVGIGGDVTQVVIRTNAPDRDADNPSEFALGSLTVGGSVERAVFLATAPLSNAIARVGKVTVGGDWIASSLAVGVSNLGADGQIGGTGFNADNRYFGNSADTYTVDNPANSSIGSVTIAGQILGTRSVEGDHYGFVAGKIGDFRASGRFIPGSSGTPTFSLGTFAFVNDVTLHALG